MKSFRLISLQVFNSDDELVDIDLTEGLIINKEDERNHWILEGFIHKDNYSTLLDSIKDQERIKLQAVITKPENSPATFDTELLTIKQVEDYYSVLFEGNIISTQMGYAEMLLEHLLEKGLDTAGLLTEFKEKLRTRPAISDIRK